MPSVDASGIRAYGDRAAVRDRFAVTRLSTKENTMGKSRRVGARASLAMLMGGYLISAGCIPNDFLQTTWETTLTGVVDALLVTPVVDAITDIAETDDDADE